MNKKIKFLAFLLAALMLVGVMPLSLFAEEATPTTEETQETTYDAGALDALASKAEGSLYTAMSYSDLAGYLGVNSSTASGENGVLLAEGHYGVKEDGSVGYIGDAKTLKGGGQLNKYSQALVFAGGEAQFIDVPAASDITVTYVNGTATFEESTRYIVFSLDVKRGEAMISGYFARIRFGSYYDATQKKDITPELWVANYRGNGKLALSNKATATVPFSTSLFTTITAVYDIETDKLVTYANGMPVETVENATGGVIQKNSINNIRDISWWYGNKTHQGRFYSLNTVRAYFVNDEETLNKCVVEDATPANGVFNIDGDYYFFENNQPVIGATRTVDGYTVVTEANTGKIIKCYKTYDTSVYDRWDAADFNEAGVSLIKDGYNHSFSVGATDTTGYAFTTVVEDGTTYYIVEPEISTIRKAYNIGTDVGDGFEFTTKHNTTSVKYYSVIPSGAEALTDTDGVTVIGYKTTTAPNKNVYPDLSYYFGLEDGVFTTGRLNINFRLKAGEALKNYGDGIVRLRYYIDGSKTNNDADIGKIQVTDDGLPHLMMGEQKCVNPVDCGILRADAYTDLSISTYLKEGNLVYDLYVNGALLAEGILIKAGITNYQYRAFGCYIGTNRYWSEPLITWGNIQSYAGDYLGAVETPFSGKVATVDGIYTYENGVATALDKNATEDGVVALKSYSVTLGETLGVNFYAAIGNAKTAVITVNGEQQIVDLTKLQANADGLYKISSAVSSINVGEKIRLAFYGDDGEVMNIITTDALYEGTYITSVKDYAKAVASNEKLYGAEAVTAVKAMLNYAAYAEKYFGKNAGFDTVIAQSDRDAVTALDASLITGTVSADGTNTSAILADAHLILNNATKIRLNLTGAAEVTSSYGGVQYVEKDGKFYIDIWNIDAKNLDTVYELTVNGINVKVSVLGIASIVANDEATYGTDFANLMKALYLYSAACEAL
ncbi:MAG: hypothetical protein IKB38_09970 [Clostridia bacterium]|nr:hypothetical protein [Clostridia bacterium]